jgi:hypothetical protein
MLKFRKSVAIALSAMALAITNQARADVGCAFNIGNVNIDTIGN